MITLYSMLELQPLTERRNVAFINCQDYFRQGCFLIVSHPRLQAAAPPYAENTVRYHAPPVGLGKRPNFIQKEGFRTA